MLLVEKFSISFKVLSHFTQLIQASAAPSLSSHFPHSPHFHSTSSSITADHPLISPPAFKRYPPSLKLCDRRPSVELTASLKLSPPTKLSSLTLKRCHRRPEVHHSASKNKEEDIAGR
ncbi:hypothetical protein SO802_032435 [Lithocarpus litseifolius]|uniref:Uncharacterized protein n=1 Tax=Lithocarpus litseifolius TaxID=425828 RepID=A0AAW2BRU8_9ROSI